MAAQRGRDMLIKIKDAQEAFITVAGLRTKNLKFNAKPIDITHSESEDAWRELLPGGGIKSVEISGAGVFCDKASDELVRAGFFAQSTDIYQLIIPDFGVIEGEFLISNLNYAGSYEGEASYDLTLNSAGKTTFTPL
ncbi:MAG TPA: phage major tail protein, TP901-1 family [Hellea balneolensis]|uniref:Phage major tail protein, TP901-1 family n=1 Tax=Hellea balneolensis TaxID=287478 RepID=A0A7C3C0Y4_9PROT|nr:phage major tail protein, TP901-1 family [Hellea balneolensis]